MGFQGLQLLKTALKKKKIIIVELMHPDFETYNEATVIKTTPTHTGIQIDTRTALTSLSDISDIYAMSALTPIDCLLPGKLRFSWLSLG